MTIENPAVRYIGPFVVSLQQRGCCWTLEVREHGQTIFVQRFASRRTALEAFRAECA